MLQQIDASELVRPVPLGEVRRFEVPDVERHGGWMLARIVTTYPHINNRNVVGWLRSIVYQSEFMFLFLDDAVALAEAVRANTFSPTTTVVERWVWARDPKNKEHVQSAARFYARFKTWAKHLDATQLVVGEASDVPLDMIEAALEGKLVERRQKYMRL